MTKNNKDKAGWNSAPDYTPQGSFWRDQLLAVCLIIIFCIVALLVGLKS